MKENNFGTISMILGIISILFSCCCGIGFFVAPFGIIFGTIGIAKKTKIKIQTNQKNQSYGMEIAGVICSIIAMLFSILAMALGTMLYYYINA